MDATADKAALPPLLLVEDNPGDARLVREMLRDAYTVTHAASLAEAVRLAAEGEKDLVLLDLSLPDSHGMETLQAILQCVDCPVVILSGMTESSVAEEAVSLGAHDYLLKGQITRAALVRVLAYTLERARHAKQRLDLEASLAQSRKLEAVGQLAAGVAHEINTPTQYVSDNTRFVRDALGDLVEMLSKLTEVAAGTVPLQPSDLAQLLETADADYLVTELPCALEQSLEGLSAITRIVQAMKQFSHPASADASPVDINGALETTMVVASNEWKYVADIEWKLDEHLPKPLGMHGELNQVFLNLIVNAAHAISDRNDAEGLSRGQITIRTSCREDGWIVVQIQDTGAGIAPEHIQQVFDPFFTTKEVGKGTGQGLAIAYDVIVKKHGGRLDVDSTPGQGTTFSIALPMQRADGSRESAAA